MMEIAFLTTATIIDNDNNYYFIFFIYCDTLRKIVVFLTLKDMYVQDGNWTILLGALTVLEKFANLWDAKHLENLTSNHLQKHIESLRPDNEFKNS